MDTSSLEPNPELATLSAEYWEKEALPVLAEYTRLPCLSPEYDEAWAGHGHIERAAELLSQWAASRPIEGLQVALSQLPGLTPVILAEVPAHGRHGDDEAPVLLYGHFDKQPPLGAWREGLGPFEPVREGDRLYGRGTADDGYSIFAALGAIELAQATGAGHPRCIAIIEGSEESGSPHLPAYLEALGERLGEAGPSLVVCLDSGAASYDRLWTTTSLRGLLGATITVKVLEEGIHSGAGGGLVPDSFRLLRQLFSRIEDEKTGEVLLPSCRVEVPAGRVAEAAELASVVDDGDRFPAVPGLRLGNGVGAAERLLARSWQASLAYVGIEGLPPIEEAGNVLRPYTKAKIAMRIPPSSDSKRAAEELLQALTTDPPEGAEVRVDDIVPADGFDAPETAPWLAAAVKAASEAYFGAPSGAMGEGGTIPFLSALLGSYPSAQFLVTGVLGPQSNAHGPNEMLHIPTAKALTACVAHVLSQIP